MKPTIGRIVNYKLNQEDKSLLSNAFMIVSDTIEGQQLVYDGSGRSNNNQDELPAIIVSVWSDTCINLQVFVDGNTGILWKTSINQGNEAGQWNWPYIRSEAKSASTDKEIVEQVPNQS
jgi:hypothetical protein